MTRAGAVVWQPQGASAWIGYRSGLPRWIVRGGPTRPVIEIVRPDGSIENVGVAVDVRGAMRFAEREAAA